MTQLSNVPMQPNPSAVERLTLIEKLEQRKQDFEAQFVSDFWILEGLDKAIDIVKQHSEWVNVDERLPTENDGRVSWGVNAYKKYILVNIVSRGIAMTCRFNLTDKCFETADKVTHWMPMPNLPSEVQDD